MRIGIQTHYLIKKTRANTVAKEQITAYYKAASSRIDLVFWRDKMHSTNADGGPADFFKDAAPDDYCRHIDAHIQASANEIKMPTIHLFISGAAPKITGAHGDGAIMRRDRRAIAVFLGTPNFTTTYATTADLWKIFFLQVCIHEIGHALTLTHGIESNGVDRHIMKQSALREVEHYDSAWEDAWYYDRPTLNGKTIPCHPLPEQALNTFEFLGSRQLMPGANGIPFSEKTHCPR